MPSQLNDPSLNAYTSILVGSHFALRSPVCNVNETNYGLYGTRPGL